MAREIDEDRRFGSALYAVRRRNFIFTAMMENAGTLETLLGLISRSDSLTRSYVSEHNLVEEELEEYRKESTTPG